MSDGALNWDKFVRDAGAVFPSHIAATLRATNVLDFQSGRLVLRATGGGYNVLSRPSTAARVAQALVAWMVDGASLECLVVTGPEHSDFREHDVPALLSELSADTLTDPPHYKDLDPEPITAIEGWGLNFHLGNAVKYITRAGEKPGASRLDDLRKARWYINREIERAENE